MNQITKPNRLACAYVRHTQKNCVDCKNHVSVCSADSTHTCAYGDELKIDFDAQIASPYKHVTDHMCPSHGPNWVHIRTMSLQDKNKDWTNNCTCGFVAPVKPGNESPYSDAAIKASRIMSQHQGEHCTCYYEEKPTELRTFDERTRYEDSLAITRVPMQLVYHTMQVCDACIAGKSQLEAEHTCMMITGELEDLCHLERRKCPTHVKQDGSARHIGRALSNEASSDGSSCYVCEACDYKTDTYTNLKEDVIATRQMVMHRMSHCLCDFVDAKTYRNLSD